MQDSESNALEGWSHVEYLWGKLQAPIRISAALADPRDISEHVLRPKNARTHLEVPHRPHNVAQMPRKLTRLFGVQVDRYIIHI